MERLIESGILDKDSLIVLNSCSVGKKGGIASEIAKKTGSVVLAPPKLNYGLTVDNRGGIAFSMKKEEESKDEFPVPRKPSKFGPRKKLKKVSKKYGLDGF